MNKLARLLLISIPLVGISSASSAMTPVGTPVKKIPFANHIDSWKALDKTQLVLSVSPQKNYLVTLRRPCHSLAFTHDVGFSTSNNTIYAGFDYITTGLDRCSIQSIKKVSRDEVKTLSEVY